MTLSVVSFLSLPVFWKAWCVSGKIKLNQRYNKIVAVFFFLNIESDLHICLTNPLNKNPFCGNQSTCSWGWSAGTFQEPFTSAQQQHWESGGKPEANFCLVRYLPLLTLFCSSSPKCLASVNRQYRQQVQATHLPTCRSHLAALGDRGLQCTAPSSPIKHRVFCSGGAAPGDATVPHSSGTMSWQPEHKATPVWFRAEDGAVGGGWLGEQ